MFELFCPGKGEHLPHLIANPIRDGTGAILERYCPISGNKLFLTTWVCPNGHEAKEFGAGACKECNRLLKAKQGPALQ